MFLGMSAPLLNSLWIGIKLVGIHGGLLGGVIGIAIASANFFAFKTYRNNARFGGEGKKQEHLLRKHEFLWALILFTIGLWVYISSLGAGFLTEFVITRLHL